jgi:hypothetical protein
MDQARESQRNQRKKEAAEMKNQAKKGNFGLQSFYAIV